ncbi:MAG: helix-turn-helix domain-containing protein [Bacteroidales bacterium]|nr:helix-turn-helix domain-containing protein [Bacteroidales bacterium]
MRKILAFLLCAVLPAVGLSAAGDTAPLVKMETERLPDLNIPRSAHVMALGPGGEPVVFGGHTTGFVPTQTAEYFADGAWHVLEMLYPHDWGFILQLRSGRIALGGGAGEAFGIGRSWGVECYDPVSRTFSSLPILDRRRSKASAAELEDGTIVVSGNWYDDDGIGICLPGGTFEPAGAVSVGREVPYILPTGPANALIFNSLGNRGEEIPLTVDRLRGGPLEVPLLAEWRPVPMAESHFDVSSCAIGDAAAGDYSYLLLGRREDGRFALILVRGEAFSLLPLSADIPAEGPGAPLTYYGPVMADRASRQAWVAGFEEPPTGRVFLLRIGYGEALDGGEAPVTLFYSDPLREKYVSGSWALLPDGTLLATGGMPRDNYNPFSSVYRFLPEGGESWPPAQKSRLSWLLGLLCGILTAGLAVFAGYRLRRRAVRAPRHDPATVTPDPAVVMPDSAAVTPDPAAVMPDPIGHLPAEPPALMTRITALMEERQLYLQPGLSLRDVAQALGTNVRYISDSINSSTGASFSDYVNGYRVRHAQALMKDRPSMPLSAVATESGFSSESTFFRNFKVLTGKTPLQWLSEFS